ncbi:MAG: hypothetical protein ACFBSE_19550 [Prochloraceae cyanobacterium]
MTYVGTKEVASILGVSIVRVRQLLAENRIEGAKKDGKFWRIPLEKGKPTIIEGKRGPKPRWLARRRRKAKTILHVNRNTIDYNRRHNLQKEVISIKKRKSNTYAKEVRIPGEAIVVYRPDRPLPCGAVLWIETYSEVKILA